MVQKNQRKKLSNTVLQLREEKSPPLDDDGRQFRKTLRYRW